MSKFVFKRTEYPAKPGAYIMRNAAGKVIYVGKAANIKSRLSNYFLHPDSSKTEALVSKIASIDFIVTKDENEALILEANLIKNYLPHYNILLKDAKHFSYLAITDEEFPRLMVARKNSAGKFRIHAKRFFGPYVEASKRNISSAYLRRLFKLRLCKVMPKKECLQYHIGNCDGPCIGKISKEDYAKNIEALTKVLEGSRREKAILKNLEKRMKAAANKEDYELAAALRDQIEALNIFFERQSVETQGRFAEDYLFFQRSGNTLFVQSLQSRRGIISSGQKHSAKINSQDEPEVAFILQHYSHAQLPHRIFTNLSTKQMKMLNSALKVDAFRKPSVAKKKILKIAADSLIPKELAASVLELKDALKLPRNPIEIETFDISTLFGENSVGSMVRFSNSKPNKNHYRKYRVKTVLGQDDYAGVKEIVSRRYYGLLKNNEALPDLILIDGGPGQLNAAMQALEELGVDIPICSIAKREELIYLPNKTKPVALSKKSKALQLLQKCRDEAHRFAITYHRKRRKMQVKRPHGRSPTSF